LDFRHKAILSYLSNSNLQSSYAALKDELALLGVSQGSNGTTNGEDEQRYKGLLEKKWTSVIRLQKKVSTTSPNVPP
jgi:platelet-activating factor acetylhydrolase IB subunit alpha